MPKTLISASNVVKAYPDVVFPSAHTKRIFNFIPSTDGFTGTVIIEGTFSNTPGNKDYTPIITATFTAHKNNLVLEVETTMPVIRARITAASSGNIALYGDSNSEPLNGNRGVDSSATAVITSSMKVVGVGDAFRIEGIIAPQFTSDDVFWANNPSVTLTEVIAGGTTYPGKQDKIGDITATDKDINLLSGMEAYGLTTDDLKKLADVNATAIQLNFLTNVTSDVQGQINSLSSSLPPGGLSGLAVTASTLNTFFDQTVSATMSDLNQLNGLTASAADLNALTGTAGTLTSADFTKLANITASATELNVLDGYTGSTADLNAIIGLTASVSDLNAIQGLAATGVTTTQLTHLAGLAQNVQAALTSITNLNGLTATVNDLNLLAGASSGTGAFSGGSISATELSYLDGLTGNIQTQLDGKRNTSDPIGINEISGSIISITELNYLDGLTGNIQAQFNSLSTNYLNITGGQMAGQIKLVNGSAAAPGLAFGTPDDDTGLYLPASGSLAISLNGTQFGTFDGTNFVIGDNATTGLPLMKGVGFGTSNPVFSFYGDEDTGINRDGANALSMIAGGEKMVSADAGLNTITIGGNVASNNVISFTGVLEGERILGRASVNGTVVANTSIYSVPVGRTAVITKIIVVLTNVSGFTSNAGFRMNVGFGAAYDEYLDNVTNTTLFTPAYGFNTTGQALTFNDLPAVAGGSGASYSVATAGTTVSASVSAAAAATNYQMDVVLIGYEY